MKPSASVAIITRTKNRPLLLKRALASVCGQTYQNWLLVLVNDGGEREPVEVLVKEFEGQLKERLHLIHNPTSLGMEAASNKGIESSESTYVVIHDDDDAWHPEFLEKVVSYMQSETAYPNLAGVVTYIEKVWERMDDDKVIEESREEANEWIDQISLWQVCRGNLFPPISFLYKREAYDKIGGKYDANLPVLGDWEFNLRFLQQYDIGVVPEILAYYHHRVPGTGNVYANTVVDGVDKHAFYDKLIRNRYLRKDIQEGQEGIGHLLNLVPATVAPQQLLQKEQQFQEQLRQIEERDATIQELKEKVTLTKGEVRAKERALHAKDQHIAALVASMDIIKRSTSWRVTAPLRIVKRIWERKRLLFYKRTYQKLMQIYRRHGMRGVMQKLRGEVVANLDAGDDLKDWFERYRPDSLLLYKLRSKNWPDHAPKFSILMCCYNTKEAWLHEAIESVIDQTYDNWELICVNDASPEDHVKKVLDQYAKRDNRITAIHLKKNRGVSGASNEGLKRVSGDYVCLMDHDDALEPQALDRFAEAALRDNADIVYSDEIITEDSIEEVDSVTPRPQFSYDFYLSHPYLVHFVGIRTQIIRDVGGFDASLPVSQDYDLMLKAIEKANKVSHVADLVYRWRTHETSVGHEKKQQVTECSKKALKGHLERIGFPQAEVKDGAQFNFYDIDFQIDAPAKVAIIIPTKNRADLLRTCVESVRDTVDEETADIYVIDHESDEEETRNYLREIAREGVFVTRYKGVFNFSAINNYGVKNLEGEYSHYLFLNNDIEALEPGWLEHMLGLCKREDVAIVGATLLYPHYEIQHAGVIVGLHGIAEHSHKFEKFKKGEQRNRGFIGSLLANRDYSAVTAACLLMRADVFKEIGGYDEDLAVGFGDTDLCLRAEKEGYKVLMDGNAVLVHYESVSRGKSEVIDPHPEDSALFLSRYRDLIDNGDPYYNPILAFDSTQFELDQGIRAEEHAPIRTVDVVLPQVPGKVVPFKKRA